MNALGVARTTVLAGLAAALVATLALAPGIGRRFLFAGVDTAPASAPPDVQVHALRARDGVAVHALEVVGPPGARVLVSFHNNRETAEQGVGLARALRARGFGVLLVEYRGYGASRGALPSEDGLYLDAEAALDMLSARGIGPERVALLGTSLGTGVAAEMARRGRGARLVLVTPYTSIPDLVTDAVPLVPARALIADPFDTLAKSKSIEVPTLVVHGDADEIVPFWMGARLAGALPRARLLRVPGGHHGDLFGRGGADLLDEVARHAGS